MKLRTGDPWMPATAYSRTLTGLSINLLVREVPAAVKFQTEVLGADIVYQDPDFAVLRGYGGEWMLHADHTYDKHPFLNLLTGVDRRGVGAELRLHGCDPDRAEAAARRLGHPVVDAAKDKPHGLREAYLEDPDGYVWVADVDSKPAPPD
jgi:catechol 2,3-dioxygenase-like lactoylglutathione lyase family enzyme